MRSDQSSISFRAGHCYKQLIGMVLLLLYLSVHCATLANWRLHSLRSVEVNKRGYLPSRKSFYLSKKASVSKYFVHRVIKIINEELKSNVFLPKIAQSSSNKCKRYLLKRFTKKESKLMSNIVRMLKAYFISCV